jgi:hypothetical protein
MYIEQHPAVLPVQLNLVELTRAELTSLLSHEWGTRPTVLLWYDEHCLGPQGMCRQLMTEMLTAAASERVRKLGDVVFARAEAPLYPDLFEPLGIALVPGLMFLLPLDNRGHHALDAAGGHDEGAAGRGVADHAGTALLSPHLGGHGLALEIESQMRRWIQMIAP